MAFVKTSTQFIAFAEYDDVASRDLRLLNEKESLDTIGIEDALNWATNRMVSRFSATDWWKGYYKQRDPTIVYNTTADVPDLNPLLIKNRESDFTDLCVYWALAKYILPSIADFSNENNAELQKMKHYDSEGNRLFDELLADGDWYDFNNDDTIVSNEKSPALVNWKRVR